MSIWVVYLKEPGDSHKKKIEQLTKRLEDVNKKFAKLSNKKSSLDSRLKNAEKDSEAYKKEIDRLLKVIEDKKSSLDEEKKSKDAAVSEAVGLALNTFQTSEEMEELKGKEYNRGESDMLYSIWSFDKQFDFSFLSEMYVDQVREWEEVEAGTANVVGVDDQPDAEIDPEFDEAGHVAGEASEGTSQDV
ncbi:hypothetical protein TorRG33x02_083340 [Trema orientale]|uniref:Uncharacterized protein n=1 Tax=Trema orientale TaxID=63057 RepID=A0A2P5FDE2_TREOI|nr:hypothetical protein TorRG33x02_083340 [Trema orientale]